jgi:hypothetical protein
VDGNLVGVQVTGHVGVSAGMFSVAVHERHSGL